MLPKTGSRLETPTKLEDPQKPQAPDAALQTLQTSKPQSKSTELVFTYNPLKSRTTLVTADQWLTVAPVVQTAVASLSATGEWSDRGIRPYLTDATRHVAWCLKEGLPLECATIWSQAVIEAHTKTLAQSQGTVRARLRKIAAANGIGNKPDSGTQRYGRRTNSDPYTREQTTGLLTFANNLTNGHRRRQLVGGILLGAACGFARGDLRGVAKHDVHQHESETGQGDRSMAALWVRTHNRCTPVRPEYLDAFSEYLTWCGDQPFVGPKEPGLATSSNITDRLVSWVGEREGVAKLNFDRLRSYFLVSHLKENTPLRELLYISGLSTIEALEPHLTHVDQYTTTCLSGMNSETVFEPDDGAEVCS